MVLASYVDLLHNVVLTQRRMRVPTIGGARVSSNADHIAIRPQQRGGCGRGMCLLLHKVQEQIFFFAFLVTKPLHKSVYFSSPLF